MKIIKKICRKVDGKQDLQKELDKDIKAFAGVIKIQDGYILRSKIMKEFHSVSLYRWASDLLDENKIKSYVEKSLERMVPVYEKEPA